MKVWGRLEVNRHRNEQIRARFTGKAKANGNEIVGAIRSAQRHKGNHLRAGERIFNNVLKWSARVSYSIKQTAAWPGSN